MEIYNSEVTTAFNEKFDFIKDIPHVQNLSIGHFNNGMYAGANYLKSFDNVSNLYLSIQLLSDFKYKSFSNFDEVILNMPPYDTALYFTNEELEDISDSVKTLSVVKYHEVEEINNEIDKIVESLNVPENASDQEKLNAILTYVLSEFEYDPDVGSYDDERAPRELIHAFYEDGALTGALTKETMICGNYAAMTSVLGKRLGLNMYNLTSERHSWNAIKLGDYYYYVDPTFLDNNNIHLFVDHNSFKFPNNNISEFKSFNALNAVDVFKSDNQQRINYLAWYLEDPAFVDKKEKKHDIESHQVSYFPEGFEIKPIPIDDNIKRESDPNYNMFNVEDISYNNYQVQINSMIYYLEGSVVLGLLLGMGIAKVIPIKKKKRKKDKETFTGKTR